MRTSALMFLFGVLAGVFCSPAIAHSPYFSQSETISAEQHRAVTLKLLNGDGIFFADPVRAVVVDQNGALLAASPSSAALRIYCEKGGMERQCLVYDNLTRTVYQPVEDEWRNQGPIEKDGKPQQYPEDLVSDFGFAGRAATLGETFRFEITGLAASWMTTGIAVAWWMLFWLLLQPASRYALGPDRQLTISRIVVLMMQTVGALLMIPIATYAWLLAPYSVIYLAFVVAGGAMTAHLLTRWRKTPAT